MVEVAVYTIDGKEEKKIILPEIFSYPVKEELIRRAVVSERSYALQPQGHFLRAGQQTTAKYYGRMNSYRSGRHMGIAIRPREKLGGGRQGKVKVIPSAMKGKRAHPHVIEKIQFERMNNKEYQNALRSCIAANTKVHMPVVVNDKIQTISKTKEILAVFNNLHLSNALETKKRLRKGVRRSTRQRIYKKSLLFVVFNDANAIKAARNIPGLDVCRLDQINANMLTPGGDYGRITVWSESAISHSVEVINKLSPKTQSKNIS